MVQSGKAKNVGIFLILFILILGMSLGILNFGFTLVSFAQETGETGEGEEEIAVIEEIETEQKRKKNWISP